MYELLNYGMSHLTHEPNTQDEYKSLLGKRLPNDLVCYQCWPVVNIEHIIIDFVYPGNEGMPESWSYMFGEYPNTKYFHPTYNEKLDAYE